MTKDDDMSWPGEHASTLGEALSIAREEDASAAQVARLAAALAPVYGVSIAASAQATTSAQAAASGASASAGASAGTVASAGALGGAGLVKVVAALLTTAAIGTTGVMSIAPDKVPAKPAIAASSKPAPAVEHEPTSAPPAVVASTDEVLAAPQAPAPAPSKRPRANAPVEAQLLTAAHEALASDAEYALKLANDHRARFPHGALAAERELLAVRALEQLQRIDQARARIARARRELPRSAPVQRAAERLGAER